MPAMSRLIGCSVPTLEAWQRWRHRRRRLHASLLLSLLLGSLWATPLLAGDDPQRLLERMHEALRQVEFEGTLVYLHGAELSALRVSQRLSDGIPAESLLSLTGPVRALSRHAQGVTCMLPDAEPLSVRNAQSSFLGTASFDFPRLRRHYGIEAQGRFRIAGRDTHVVGVQAKDGYRYGYRFYVDDASGLPLKVDLLTEDGQAVQQLMFTDIDIEVAAQPRATTPRRVAVPASGPEDEVLPDADIVITQLPPGFRIVSRKTLVRDDGHDIHQRVVSDGLAAFSIYVEPPMDGALRGRSQLGAVTAAGRRVDGHQVTVVGEVPPATAHMVLEHIEVMASP